MREQIIKALIAHAQGDIEKHKANIDYMCLPKNGMAMFTSETGQQALSLLQQLPGKVGCDVQRSRCVEEKIPEPNFSLTPLLTMRRSICHYSLP